MTDLSEEEVAAMGRKAIELGLLKVVGKISPETKLMNTYLLVLASNPKRACTYKTRNGEFSIFDDVRLFRKFGAWYHADKIDYWDEIQDIC